MDKRATSPFVDQSSTNASTSDQWQALSDLELASVGGGIGDTVL